MKMLMPFGLPAPYLYSRVMIVDKWFEILTKSSSNCLSAVILFSLWLVSCPCEQRGSANGRKVSSNRIITYASLPQCFAFIVLCVAAAQAVPDCDHGYSYPQPQVQLKVAPAVESVSYTPGYSTYSTGGAVKYSSVGPAYSSYAATPAIHSYSAGPAYSSVDYTPGVTYAKSSGIVLANQSPSAQYARVAAPLSYGYAHSAPAVSYAAAAPIVQKAYLPPVTQVRIRITPKGPISHRNMGTFAILIIS